MQSTICLLAARNGTYTLTITRTLLAQFREINGKENANTVNEMLLCEYMKCFGEHQSTIKRKSVSLRKSTGMQAVLDAWRGPSPHQCALPGQMRSNSADLVTRESPESEHRNPCVPHKRSKLKLGTCLPAQHACPLERMRVNALSMNETLCASPAAHTAKAQTAGTRRHTLPVAISHKT